MGVGLDEARRVLDDVLKAYEHALPKGLADDVRKLGAGKIISFHKKPNYAPFFSAYFRSWFAATNVNYMNHERVTGKDTEVPICGKPQKLLQNGAKSPITPTELQDKAKTLRSHTAKVTTTPSTKWAPTPDLRKPDILDTTLNCPAFTSPAVNPLHRRIYVNDDAGINEGTLYHEYVHYLSHGNFYPEFYGLGGRSAIVVEGVTEYLTRDVSAGVKIARAGRYQGQYLDVTGKMGGESSKTRDEFEALLFRGELSVLSKLDAEAPHHLKPPKPKKTI